MDISVSTKFEVGNLVTIKGTIHQFRITQIVLATCSAATQILYEGKVLSPIPSYSKDKGFAISAERKNINEIELGEVIDESPKKDNDS